MQLFLISLLFTELINKHSLIVFFHMVPNIIA